MTSQEARGVLADAEVKNRNIITLVIQRGDVLRRAHNAAVIGRDHGLSHRLEALIAQNGRVLSALMAD